MLVRTGVLFRHLSTASMTRKFKYFRKEHSSLYSHFSNFEPVWDFCHDKLELDDDVGLDHDSFIGCGKAFGVIFGDAHISFSFWETFFDVLWKKADWDQSGEVIWREWRYAEAVFAGVYSKVTFDRNDGNNDQVMDSKELNSFGGSDFADRKVEREAIYDIWKQSQLDGDEENGDMREMSLFWMNFWNLLVNEFE